MTLGCLLAIYPSLRVQALEVEALNYPAWLVRDYETRPLLPGARLGVNDLLRTGDGGRVRLRFDDGSSLGIGQKSRLLVESYTPAVDGGASPAPVRLQVLRGVFRYARAAASAPAAAGLEIRIGAITVSLEQAEIWGRSDQGQDLACLMTGLVDVIGADGDETPLRQPLSCYVKPRAAAALPVDRVDEQQHRLWLAESAVDTAAGIAAADGEWQLVLISLTDVDSADRELWRLRELGYPVSKKSVIRQGRTLHRLLIPGFVSAEDALAARGRIEGSLGIRDAWVWKRN